MKEFCFFFPRDFFDRLMCHEVLLGVEGESIGDAAVEQKQALLESHCSLKGPARDEIAGRPCENFSVSHWLFDIFLCSFSCYFFNFLQINLVMIEAEYFLCIFCIYFPNSPKINVFST